MNEVYYRLLYSIDKKTVIIVCMQDFDERDYNQNLFITKKRFNSENEAYLWYDHWLTGKTNLTFEKLHRLALSVN